MNRNGKTTFLALILAQAIHSIEEYAFGFFEVFPPAQRLNELLPGIAQPGFVVFNTALVLFGLWCFFRRIRPDAPSARSWAWLWVAIELYNGIGHPVWALAIRAYNPGLYSAPLLFGLALFLVFQLRSSTETVRDPAAP